MSGVFLACLLAAAIGFGVENFTVACIDLDIQLVSVRIGQLNAVDERTIFVFESDRKDLCPRILRESSGSCLFSGNLCLALQSRRLCLICDICLILLNTDRANVTRLFILVICC